MYENLVSQSAVNELRSDIKNNLMPSAMLFSGSEATGKLTAALETARILSCHAAPQGKWLCTCPSCLQHKALTCQNLLLLGPRDCALEISAAKKTFLEAAGSKATHLDAARYLFLRSVRKLTLRFNPILWNGEANLNKIAAIMEGLNEALEQLDFPRELVEHKELETLCDELEEKCLKLETEYLYDSIPVNQVRNMEEWAHIKSEEGKKTIIIENADRMQTSVRNALLKILEEPPEDCVFILLSSKRNAIMPTILSRVRTYNFKERNEAAQLDVIKRVFHNQIFEGSINQYMLNFLPVKPAKIESEAKAFYDSVINKTIPDITVMVKNCESFIPRVELKLFLNAITVWLKPLQKTERECEMCAQIIKQLHNCWENITMYNQSPVSALEILYREMRRCVDM